MNSSPSTLRPRLWRLRSATAIIALALAISTLVTSVLAGTHTWSGSGGNNFFSNPANWSAGGAPISREANVVLIFPAAAPNKNVIQDIESLGIDQMVIQGDGYFFIATGDANYFLRGGVEHDIDNGSNNDTRFGMSGALVLNGPVSIKGSSGSVLIEGAISGPGGLTVIGPTVELAGNTVNTYTGLTRVQNGTLRLNKEIGVGFAGDLEIGITLGADNNERVILARNNQIPDASTVTVKSTGWLDLNGYSDTVGPMVLIGAKVTTGAGTLTFGGNIQVPDHDDFCSINGKVNLGTGTRVINVETNAMLDLLATVSGAAATSFSKQGPGHLLLSAVNSFTTPFHINEGAVSIFDSGALGSAAGHTYVHAGATMQLYGVNVSGGETIHLSGPGLSGYGALAASGFGTDYLLIQGNLVMETDATISVDTNITLSVNGVISGPGGFIKTGPGALWMEGSAANTHTGTNRVHAGTLLLSRTAGTPTMAGPLVIGDDVGALEADVVEWASDHQLPANTKVTVRGTGLLKIAQQAQALGGLTLAASAQVEVNGVGVLTLPALVTSLDEGYVSAGNGNAYTSRISGTGRVLLAGPTTFDTHWVQGIDVEVSGGANAHLTKIGAGSLILDRSNSFGGLTIIKDGDLSAAHSRALGATAAGTIVTNSGSLGMAYASITNESLTLAGDNENDRGASLTSATMVTWAGPITLVTDSVIKSQTYNGPGSLRIQGVISGGGKLIKAGTDSLELAGNAANTYHNETIVQNGRLILNKTGGVAIRGALTIGDGTGADLSDEVFLLQDAQINDSAVVKVLKPGMLNLNSHYETIGSLEGDGTVSTLLGTLTTGGNGFTTTFHGIIGGIGFTTLIKEGTGTMSLTGDNAYTGKTLVNEGRLIVHGQITGAAIVAPAATLGGYGSVGIVTNEGIVNPGLGTGKLTAKTVTFRPGSTLKVELNGTTAGLNYDQLSVTGAVNLVGASLDATLSFNAGASDEFRILDNDGNDAIAGTFNFLPQNSTFQLNGQLFRISYTGGDGNDVVLSRANTPPSLTQITATPFTNESGHVHINGSISDPDAGDTFQFTVNWGDGSPQQTIDLPAGTQVFHLEHQYVDDKPGAQPSDSFTIEYTLTDASGSPAFGQLNTIIGNVEPTVYGGGTVAIPSGLALVSTLTFADPGSDAWTATVDYGDGSGVQPLTIGEGKSLPMNHSFPSNGVYTVKLEVSDDDTGKGSTTFTVMVGLNLTIAKGPQATVDLSWDSGFTGCILQTSPEVNGTNWLAVPGAPTLVNDRWVQNVAGTNTTGFFRLTKP
jgi:fibronectin-binding autotransporter adhesin